MVSQDTPDQVYFLLLCFDLQPICHIHKYVSLLIITKVYSSHKFRINCFVIFCNKNVSVGKNIYNISKVSITNTKQKLKVGAISGVRRSFLGRP